MSQVLRKLALLFLALGCLAAPTTAATTVSGILETSVVTVSGLSSNQGGTSGEVRLVACVSRARTDGEPGDSEPDRRQYNFIEHLNSNCSMELVNSHTASIRMRCIAGPDPITNKTIPVYYDTRLYDGAVFVESDAGGELFDDLAFEKTFTQVDEVMEMRWESGPQLYNTTQSHTLLYKAGVWQGLMSQWTSRASVGL